MSDTDNLIIDTYEYQKAADTVRNRLTDEDVSLMRREAKNDLFFLANTVLGYPDLALDFHGQYCKWLIDNKAARFKLSLQPRGHLKTTIGTVADAIQVVLPDDQGNQPFPYNLGTDARILLSHEILDTAKENLKSIRDKIYGAPLLRALYPEIIPDKGMTVNQTEMELRRKSQWPETTFTVMGVGSSGQGKHFDKLKLDDIVGLKALSSPAELKSALDWYKDISGMYTRLNQSQVDFIGVRYAMDDIYSVIQKDYEGMLKIYTRSIWEWKDGVKTISWPERVTWEMIEFLKNQDLKRFNAQYMNNPLEIEGEFEMAWEKYYEAIEIDGIVRFLVVEDKVTGLRRKIDIRDLDILIFLDPAMTGNSGIIVTGTDKLNNVYVLEAIQEALVTEKLLAKIFSLQLKWAARAVVIEFVLFSGLYDNLFKRDQYLKNQYFRILPARTRQKQKEDRVRTLRPYFANGQIYFHKSQESLIQQYRYFGSIKEYHILDAMAYGPEFWRAAAGRDEFDRRESALMTLSDSRSLEMGYSKIRYA